jgi:hypothetical protein
MSNLTKHLIHNRYEEEETLLEHARYLFLFVVDVTFGRPELFGL